MGYIGLEAREQEAFQLRRKYKLPLQIMAGVLAVIVLIILGFSLFDKGKPYEAYSYLINLFTSGISVAIAVFVLDKLAERRETKALQKRLLREARGQSNEIAKAAIDWLRDEGWLTGEEGLLKGQKLLSSNLAEARLDEANLEGTNLSFSNLQGVSLWKANLKNADLTKCNLASQPGTRTNLNYADLEKAKLINTDLSRASVEGVNLQNATLLFTN